MEKVWVRNPERDLGRTGITGALATINESLPLRAVTADWNQAALFCGKEVSLKQKVLFG